MLNQSLTYGDKTDNCIPNNVHEYGKRKLRAQHASAVNKKFGSFEMHTCRARFHNG